jgi:hypothetical protein
MKQCMVVRFVAALALVGMLSFAAPVRAHAAAGAPAAAVVHEDGRSWAVSLWQRMVDLILGGGGGGGARPAAPAGRRHGVVTAGQSTADSGSASGPSDSSTINPDG